MHRGVIFGELRLCLMRVILLTDYSPEVVKCIRHGHEVSKLRRQPARPGPTTLLNIQNTELFATHSIVADWEKTSNLMIGLLGVNDMQNVQPHYLAYFKLSVVRGSSSPFEYQDVLLHCGSIGTAL
jgi:hypothetical protein